MRRAYDFVIVGAGSAGCGLTPLAAEHLPHYRGRDRARAVG